MASTPTLPPATGWIHLINESVHTSDDVDIGDIEAVNKNFVVVKRGFVNIHYYYIPQSKVEGWDGFVLWLNIAEVDVKRNYEKNIPPDPARYYLKDFPSNYPQALQGPTVIVPRYTRPVYTTALAGEQARVPKCDLCGTQFNTEEELTNHIKTAH